MYHYYYYYWLSYSGIHSFSLPLSFSSLFLSFNQEDAKSELTCSWRSFNFWTVSNLALWDALVSDRASLAELSWFVNCCSCGSAFSSVLFALLLLLVFFVGNPILLLVFWLVRVRKGVVGGEGGTPKEETSKCYLLCNWWLIGFNSILSSSIIAKIPHTFHRGDLVIQGCKYRMGLPLHSCTYSDIVLIAEILQRHLS